MLDSFYLFVIGFLFAVSVYGLFFTVLYLFKDNSFLKKLPEKFKNLPKYLLIISIGLIGVALVLVILLFSLKKDDIKITHDYIARFNDAGTVDNSSDVFFRGVDVGDVKEVTVSEDSKYALIKFKITSTNLKLTEGTVAEKTARGFASNDDLVLVPPKDGKDKKELKKGAIIPGKTSFNNQEMQKILSNLFEEGKLQELINDTSNTLENLNKLTSNLVEISDENKENLKAISGNLKTTTSSINQVFTDKQTVDSIKSAVSSSKDTVENLNTFIDKAGNLAESSTEAVKNIDSTLNDKTLKGNLTTSVEKMSTILTDIQDFTSDKDVNVGIKEAILESSKGIKSINCFSRELTRTINKRFLIPRMIIGKPGKSIESCFPPLELEEELKSDTKETTETEK